MQRSTIGRNSLRRTGLPANQSYEILFYEGNPLSGGAATSFNIPNLSVGNPDYLRFYFDINLTALFGTNLYIFPNNSALQTEYMTTQSFAPAGLQTFSQVNSGLLLSGSGAATRQRVIGYASLDAAIGQGSCRFYSCDAIFKIAAGTIDRHDLVGGSFNNIVDLISSVTFNGGGSTMGTDTFVKVWKGWNN